MSKAVMLSIRPKWCQKIASGEKTIEVRKTKPKLETPFKCYIYCTLPKYPHEDFITTDYPMPQFYGGGKVIGEFTCDRIDRLAPANEPYGIYDIDDDYVLQTCLENGALWDYGHGIPPALSFPTGLRRTKLWKKEQSKHGTGGLAMALEQFGKVRVVMVTDGRGK